jgi:amidohydrolase
VLAFPTGQVATRSGPTLAAADSMRITVHGRGAHGSMPQASIDPVVLAAMIVVRLQTVISREIHPGEPAVVTVGSVQAGTKSNVIPDHATILLNIRTYSEGTRSSILDAIKRIVTAECAASRSPRPPESLLSRARITATMSPQLRRRGAPQARGDPGSARAIERFLADVSRTGEVVLGRAGAVVLAYVPGGATRLPGEVGVDRATAVHPR